VPSLWKHILGRVAHWLQQYVVCPFQLQTNHCNATTGHWFGLWNVTVCTNPFYFLVNNHNLCGDDIFAPPAVSGADDCKVLWTTWTHFCYIILFWPYTSSSIAESVTITSSLFVILISCFNPINCFSFWSFLQVLFCLTHVLIAGSNAKLTSCLSLVCVDSEMNLVVDSDLLYLLT